MRRAVRRGFGLVVWAALAVAGGLAGQAAVDLEATVEADSVRVGEAFTVRLAVGQARGGEVRFPALMDLPESLEQTAPVQIRSVDEGRRWEAEYSLVAWRADTLAIPPVEVQLVGAGGVTRTLEPSAVVVSSVLPEAEGTLELRDARPFLRLGASPWWILAVLAAVAALAWWTWGRRRHAAVPQGPLHPGELALREFERLRRVWVERGLSGDRFYDGYEGALRRYADATRGWAASRELVGLGDSDAGLISALRHSIMARFARLRTDRDGPIADIEIGEAFVRSDMADETAAAEATSGAPDALSGAAEDAG
ncbi:hypothetical protein [Candidatus Palauibacter sp.]|uniref:hypothetical protein n=1 Tax=Candidatus Palauibacter sp. TaxID=3101350 RepID=UPI003B027E59